MSTDNHPHMAPDEILDAWSNFNYTFPKAAFIAALAQQEEMTPRLLEVVADIANFPDSLGEAEDYYPSLYALYTLAWFRESRILPPLKRLFDRTGEGLFELWGDEVSIDAPRLFASWAYANPDALKPFIEKCASGTEMDRSSVLEAYIVLYHAGVVTADGMHPYLQHIADSVLRKDGDIRDGLAWYSWGRCCFDLGIEDLYPLVKTAYEKQWVDPMITRWEDEEKVLLAGRKAILERSKKEYGGLIENPLQEMRGWYCFTEEARQDDMRRAREESGKTARRDASRNDLMFHPDTIVNAAPKIKPNAPCPCGSGKKYKKCCGRK